MKFKKLLNTRKRRLIVLVVSIIFLGGLAFASLFLFKETKAAWYNDNWLYRKKINIDNTRVSGTSNHSNFPVLISITDQDLAKKAQSDGDDILFTDTSGNKLDHEIESYDSTTGTLVTWVEISTLYYNQDTPLLMYYGNSSASNQENATGTWDEEGNNNYVGVWHLKEDPSGAAPQMYNSVGNGGSATSSGAMTISDQVAGKINGSLDFDSQDDFLSSTTPDHYSHTYTATAWFKTTDTADGQVLDAEEIGSKAPLHLHVNNGVVTAAIRDDVGSTTISVDSGSDTYNDGGWHRAVVIRTGDDNGSVTVQLIVDDQDYSTDSNTLDTTNTDGLFIIGKRLRDAASSRYFEGQIDEVQLSNTNRSTDWLATEYNNQSSPSTFYSLQGEETQPEGPVAFWKFDEGYGQTAHDTTENANAGQLGSTSGFDSNDPTWQTEDLCISGKCLYFDGTDKYMDVPDPGTDSILDFSNGDEITIATWIRPISFNSNGSDWVNILEKGNTAGVSTGSNYQFGFDDGDANTTSQQLRFTYIASGDVVHSFASTDNVIELNKWTHIEFTYTYGSDSTAKIYINGLEVNGSWDIGTGNSAPIESNEDLWIGANNYSGGESVDEEFFGFIDEVKIYPYARTADQIKADYQKISTARGASASFGPDQSYLSNGLVGYWKMDETSGTNVADSSGNGGGGTATDGDPGDSACSDGDTPPIATGSAKFAYARDFDGCDDFVNVSAAADVRNLEQLTISTWIYPRTEGESNTGSIYQSDPASNDIHFQFSGSAANAIYFSRRLSTTSVDRVMSDSSITLNQWQHVVVTWNGGTDASDSIHMYVNGNEVSYQSEQDGEGTVPSEGVTQRIGAKNTGANSRAFDGFIDEFRFYNRALTPSEVEGLYRWAPGPVGYWKMDENQGQTAYDTSGNGNNGSFTNSPGWEPGKYGSAITTSKNNIAQSVTVTDPPSGILDFSDSQSYTVSAWLKMNGLPESNTEVVDKRVGVVDEGYDLQVKNDGDIACQYEVDTGSSNSATWNNNNVTDGQWHYITCIMDREGTLNGTPGLYAFVDGIQSTDVDTSLVSGNSLTNEDVNIGELNGTSEYNGAIDETKIYNYARTQEQIIEDMNAGHPAPGSPVGSPVGYWKFDEGYGTSANDTINNKDLTLNTASWTNNGKYGKAWDGDQAEWMYRTDDNDLDFAASDNFTISTWFKSDTTGSSSGKQIILTKGSEAAAGYQMYFRSGADIVTFATDDDATWDAGTDQVVSVTDVYDGNWHHILATRTGTTKMQLYIDGVLEDEITSFAETGTLANSSTLYFGDLNGVDDGNGELDGDIDETKIYRFAFTASQVATEYNQGKAQVFGATSTDSSGTGTLSAGNEYCPPGQGSSCTGPVAEWLFNKNQGQTAYDTSENNNNGQLGSTSGSDINDPTWAPGYESPGLKFDGGNDYVSAGTATELNDLPNGDFTVSFWQNFNLSSADDFPIFIGKEDDLGSTGWTLLTEKSNADLYFAVNYPGGTDAQYISDPYYILDKTWQHITLVWHSSSKSANTYVNGVETTYLSTQPGSGTYSTDASDSLILGGDNTGSKYSGQLDDIRIYDYARTPAQIAWEYNRGKPVGWWKLDDNVTSEGDTVSDSSGNGNDGTLYGDDGSGDNGSGMDCDVAGKRNTACDFDGSDDYINITDNGSWFDFGTGDFTYSTWVKTTQDCSGGKVLVGRYDNSRPAVYIACRYTNGLAAWVPIDSNSIGGEIESTSSINDGQWHQVVGTKEGHTSAIVKLYIDGKLENTRIPSYTGTFTHDATSETSIGRLNVGPYYWADAEIDDVRIYNYALTQQQINDIYNEGSVHFGP
jgi:hypothetical protein